MFAEAPQAAEKAGEVMMIVLRGQTVYLASHMPCLVWNSTSFGKQLNPRCKLSSRLSFSFMYIRVLDLVWQHRLHSLHIKHLTVPRASKCRCVPLAWTHRRTDVHGSHPLRISPQRFRQLLPPARGRFSSTQQSALIGANFCATAACTQRYSA